MTEEIKPKRPTREKWAEEDVGAALEGLQERPGITSSALIEWKLSPAPSGKDFSTDGMAVTKKIARLKAEERKKYADPALIPEWAADKALTPEQKEKIIRDKARLMELIETRGGFSTSDEIADMAKRENIHYSASFVRTLGAGKLAIVMGERAQHSGPRRPRTRKLPTKSVAPLPNPEPQTPAPIPLPIKPPLKVKKAPVRVPAVLDGLNAEQRITIRRFVTLYGAAYEDEAILAVLRQSGRYEASHIREVRLETGVQLERDPQQRMNLRRTKRWHEAEAVIKGLARF